MDVIEEGRRILQEEAGGLLLMADFLGSQYQRAVECILEIEGRVIVSGMGKSGHVGRKIAATFASTGTPAQFVHPAEASHGDLGMIGDKDAVLALSNSGDTRELTDIIIYTRRHAIPLISVTGKEKSMLGRESDTVLLLPTAREACPHNLAPTTSTTMMLGLGDALAISLLRARGFSPDDFLRYHPGGKLGHRILKVADLMHGPEAVAVVPPEAPMHEVVVCITRNGYGCAAVVNSDNSIAGVITDGDLRRHMSPDLLIQKAESIMTRHPKTIEKSQIASTALRMMNERRVTSLLIDENGYLAGIIHIHDLLRAGIG